MNRTVTTALPFALLAAAVSLPAADIPNGDAAVTHALNRLAFGPRPGEVARVKAEGLSHWIERQLNPDRIDDRALAARLPDRPDPVATADSPKEMRRLARRAIDDLAADKLTRATYSERQLEEVLADFWFNHFNVFAAKGRTAVYLPSYERDAIRPHVLGRFRDLLGATAHHPAMLLYLDNAMSGRNGGLNENYARELMELHTLGVEGGYSQTDVTEVARAFTGWTIGRGATGGFRFARAIHDPGTKTVLGRTIREDGEKEGEQVLDILAAHAATARHIATKLAQRFVSDDPPPALVDRAAARFRETGGNLRDVVRTIVTSPEFFASAARGAKVKTPLEFLVSAARASGADGKGTRPMLRALRELGMPLYLCQPPTGYDDTAATWITPGALVARMNIAQSLGDAATIGSPAFQRR
jgi:uncharacterized protein (DUF1800 family)